MSSNIRTRKEIEKSIAVLLEGRFGQEFKEDKTKMFEKMMAGSRKHLFSFLAAAFAATVFVGFAPSQASAMASVEKEREWAMQDLAEDRAKYEMVQSQPGSPLRHMQDELIKYNSDKLNYDDGKHDRWLEPVWLCLSQSMASTGWSQGGYVAINQRTVGAANGMEHPFKMRENTERNIYNNSTIAKTLAHEFGHFINNDARTGATKKSSTSIKCEYAADEMAMVLLGNVPEYSAGSEIDVDLESNGNGYDPALGYQTHPSEQDRAKAELAYIKKISGGRVVLDRDCHLTVDGKLFMGTGYLPDSEDGKGVERTVYLAGQIATCIQKGIWKRENIAHAAESYFFSDGRDNKTTLAVWSTSEYKGTPAKILGTFDYDSRKSKDERTPAEKDEVHALNYIMDLTD